MKDELGTVDPLFIDIVDRIGKALAPLQPTLTEEVVNAMDALALAVMETIKAAP